MSDPRFDDDGFLRDPSSWTVDDARQIADREGLTLTAQHWSLIDLARDYYQRYDQAPNMRPLVKIVRAAHGEAIGSSIGLMGLFTDNPAKQLSKIAGLPKPSQCI
ncbi:MAG: TusE/DsrC/DsvC family sulfur relay protein [Pseudomonadota bacterium]